MTSSASEDPGRLREELPRQNPSAYRPEPLFILCPGRSFSSVVSAIIGQHPDCYGLPELDLFLGETLAESMQVYERTGRAAGTGLKRLLAELHSGEQTEDSVDAAAVWIRANGHLSGQEVLDHIRALVAPRMVVDKSPSNVVAPASLERLAKAYRKASFLQLLRHPRSRGVSQMSAMRHLFVLRVMGHAIDFESKWTDTHIMIDEFGRQLPPAQLMRLRGEDFLRDLPLYLPQICEWLGLRAGGDALERMLHPENSPYSSVGPRNARWGANRGFLESPALDFERLAAMKEPTLDDPMEWAPDRLFSEATRRLAADYGYR